MIGPVQEYVQYVLPIVACAADTVMPCEGEEWISQETMQRFISLLKANE
jgi:hypothetical protein